MKNPDGVVFGNYRTGGAGKDLNRVYKKDLNQVKRDNFAIFYPTVYNILKLLKKIKEGVS